MKKKLFSRLLCASLAVLMMVCALPAISVGAASEEDAEEIDYTSIAYANEAERLAAMTKYYDNGEYALYCDNMLGVVAYQKLATGEVLFTNPWDMTAEANLDSNVRAELMSQIVMEYVDSENLVSSFNSYTDAALKGQITVKSIKNGIRVEYAIGERSSRILCPMQIEKTAFNEKILEPLAEAVGATSRTYIRFAAYFNLQEYTTSNATKQEAIAITYPICKDKNIDLYVCDPNASTKQLRELEALIQQYCPSYTFEEMDNDYDYVNYEEEAISPPVFKMALEYVISTNGLQVTLPANGLRYDETSYRITDFQVLPYMGASLKTSDGYSFIPDGSGTIYELSTSTITASRVYGEDYALYSNVAGYHNATVRMPVFGQVEKIFYPDLITPAVLDAVGNVITPAVYSKTEGETVSRGYVAIIEDGATMASIAPNHLSYMSYTSVIPSFVTRQSDTSQSNWSVYACRRYTGDYRIRYMLLSDDGKAASAGLTSYYECSWMGMACAYRDYMAANNETYQRLTEEDVETSIPLYIETFGCVDTVKKILSMPVTVSVALTTFEDVATMYDYLAGNGVTNVNFKMTGYANGGLYSDVPYKLKWESSVGGKSGFKELAAYAKEKGFGIYPDFDFVYTTNGDGGSAVKMKKNASRTIDNRYTTKRVYSATMQTLVSYYQMVLSPATYSKFYEKLEKKYSKYKDVSTISLSTLGSELNSDYDENKTVLREEAKDYVVEALAYFKDEGYDLMINGGNSYTWAYADHILKVPLDSSRYNAEYLSVPFMGVVLHGYVQFAGDPLNMEGDLSYAMLKAMENGASIYFVLSYANTELLKEDELLSQNYSVRYDIWQNRLVEIYKELNAVLGDVQTKLIIGHEFLDGSRVPEEDEILQDIVDKMEEEAKALEEKIKADQQAAVKRLREARETVKNTVSNMSTLATSVLDYVNLIKEQRNAFNSSSYLTTAWNNYKTEIAKADDDPSKNVAEAITSLKNWTDTYVASPIAQITVSLQNASTQLTAAKTAYDTLVENNADALLVENARAQLFEILDSFATLYGNYYGTTAHFEDTVKSEYINGAPMTVDQLLARISYTATPTAISSADLEAFLLGNDEEVEARYTVVGAAQIKRAYIDLLISYGLYNEADKENSAINYAQLLQARLSSSMVTEEPDEEPEDPDAGESGGEGDSGLEDEDIVVPDAPKSKYSMDNALVLVTYGEPGTPYKSLILNFNDYAVQTTVNGVTYTIEGYDYVVIYYA